MNNPSVSNSSDRNNNNGSNFNPLNVTSLLQPYALSQQQMMNQQQQQQQQQRSQQLYNENQLQLSHLNRDRNQMHESFYEEDEYVIWIC